MLNRLIEDKDKKSEIVRKLRIISAALYRYLRSRDSKNDKKKCTAMKKLPVGIQSIKKILSNNEYVYVDKTGFVKKLIDEGTPHYFLSRPRRFGKSLFLSTLEEIFQGNKALFKGCEIYKSNSDWKNTLLFI